MTDQQVVALPEVEPRARAFRLVARFYVFILILGLIGNAYFMLELYGPRSLWLDEDLEASLWQAYAAVRLLVFLISALLFLMWHYRVHYQLHAVRGSGVKFSPSMVVVGWLIPLANLVLPYLVVRSSWRASYASMDRADGSLPGYLIFWWFGYLLGETLTSVADNMFENTSTVQSFTTATIVESVGFICLIVSALLALRLVKQITARINDLKMLAQASQFD